MNYKKKYKLDVSKVLEHENNYEVLKNKLNLKDGHIQNKENNFMKKKVAIISACACVALVVGVTTVVATNLSKDKEVPVTSLVKMDLNPSVSFLVDKNNKVVSVKGENNEGKMIIAGEEIEGKDLDKAIEIVLTIENETGYLVSGNARIDDNNLSFSITTDNEKIKDSLKKSIDATVNDVCDKLNVQETISYIEEISRANLEEIALKCDPTLTKEDVQNMSYEQLFNVIKIYNIETAMLYSEELEELYTQVKEYNIKFAESEYTKDVISAMGNTYALLMKGYDILLSSLQDSIDYLNNLKYESFVSETSAYQKTIAKYESAKKDLLVYKNQLATADVENKDLQESLIKLLDAQIEFVDGIQTSINEAADFSNALIDKAIAKIDEYMKELEDYKEKYFLSQEDIEAKLTQSAKDLENTINTTKDNAFKNFEEKYGDDIKNCQEKVLAYKQELKDSLKNKA